MGYITAKAIENPRSCNDSSENDPRLKRSDEKDIHLDSEDTTRTDPDDVATRKMLSKPNNENDNNHDTNDNYNENSNEFTSNSNTLPQTLPLVNNVTKFPANVEKEDIVPDKLTTIKKTPLQERVYYKPIDPKYLIISGMSLPKHIKNITNVSKSEGPGNIDLKETTTLDYSNFTKATNVSNRDEANETVTKEVVVNDAYTDVLNIRELREHLLDHLLDYFLNIIKEENYIRNDTRKKYGKDRMKVEEKLRNYYDPHHLDMLFVDDDDDDYYDNNLYPSDYREGNDSEEDLPDNVKQNKEINKENITYIVPLNALSDDVNNTAEAHISEDRQNVALNLEQNLNSSSPHGESVTVNLLEPLSESGPVTSKYVNLIEKENYLSNALLNTTEKPEEAFDTNVNIITTTERSISNEAFNDEAAEIDTDILNYSEEAVTDRIEYVYDNGALTVDDYTSYEDYIDSDEFEVVKNVTVHENDRNPIVITTENGRRENGIDKEKYIANGTLNATYTNNSQIGNETTTSKDIASKKEHKPNKLAILELPNKNINDNSSCNEDNLAENKNKNSTKNSKQDTSIKRKLKNIKNCALSIIFTNQVEARTFNKTHELKKNEEYDIISKSAYKHSDRANEIGKNDTELMNKIYTHFDLRSDTNAESRHDILSRYKYNQAMAQTIAMEKVKQEGATKLESNYESSLQNYVEKENQPTVTPVQRQKHLTLRHRNTKIRSTQEVREEQLIPKITHKRNAEVETEICKTKHCDYKNHRSFEKRSREHNDYKLKRRDEFKTETKHNNKRKVNKNNMKVEHRFIKSHRTFNPQENSVYEIEQRDIKKPVSNMISMENDIYVQKHIHDFRISLEQPVSKQVYPEYKPKFSQNFQKKRERDKKVRKVRDIDNAKHDKEKVISNREKYKPTLNENRESVSETHTGIRKGENKINANSADILNPDDADSQTLENQDEKEILDSCDDLSKENNHLNKPRLIFYVSSTTKRVKEIFTKLPKKLVSQKDERETDKLLGDLNSVLGGNSDLKNIDLNTKINRLASSKILDFITDRVAVQMLKKLENILEFKNPMGRTEGDPEKVEQIDILFKNDGDMVMKGREHIKEKEEDENGTREAFYSK